MDQTEFVKSLSPEQSECLLVFRNDINDHRDQKSQELVVEHARRITEFEALLTQQMEAATKEREALVESHTMEKARLTKLYDELVASTTTEKESLNTQIAELKELKTSQADSITALTAKVAWLLAELPFDPRIIDSKAFIRRLTAEEALDLRASKDQATIEIANTLELFRTNHWPIKLDSPEFTEPIGYLAMTGQLTAERVKEVSRDATRDEAYFATEATPAQAVVEEPND